MWFTLSSLMSCASDCRWEEAVVEVCPVYVDACGVYNIKLGLKMHF